MFYFQFSQFSFSNGGHLFAAANANLIQVYGTFSFDNTANLKGHSGKIKKIVLKKFVAIVRGGAQIQCPRSTHPL